MTSSLAGHVALELRESRTHRVHASHTSWLHDWFAHDPWIAWPVAGLAAILLVLLLAGRLIFRTIGGAIADVPWWARLGLIGAIFLWWRKGRTAAGPAQTHPAQTDPAQWIDLRSAGER